MSCIEDLDQTLQSLLDAKPSTVRVAKMSQYHHKAGKVVLAGDAAHTMTSAMGLVKPFFGLGIFFDVVEGAD